MKTPDYRNYIILALALFIFGLLIFGKIEVSELKAQVDKAIEKETTYRGDINQIFAPPGSKFAIYCQNISISGVSEIKVYFGKSRRHMDLEELKSCLKWVRRVYPIEGRTPEFIPDGVSRTRGSRQRVPTKAQPWPINL